MFISHHIDITSHLTSPLNILQIDFDSAQVRGKEIQREKESGGEHVYNARQGEIERLGVRKAQYHWGWDWGPKYMTCGPWRPVRIETYSCRIEDLKVEYVCVLDEMRENVQGVISAQIDGNGNEKVRLTLRDEKGEVIFQTDGGVGSEGLAQTPFSLPNPELWYPHGYGSQPLYSLACELIVHGTTVQSMTKRIGFRTAELIQEPDKYGKSFYFRVNGIDVFAGGSCWIPADNFIPRLTPKKYKEWMKLMVESNQIMTR